jgi:hypothetical protein
MLRLHRNAVRFHEVDGQRVEGVFLCAVHAAPIIDLLCARVLDRPSVYDLLVIWAEDRESDPDDLPGVIRRMFQELGGFYEVMGVPLFLDGRAVVYAKEALSLAKQASGEQVGGVAVVSPAVYAAAA